jgi:hypothetical protein
MNWRSNDRRNQNRGVATQPVALAHMGESMDQLLAWYRCFYTVLACQQKWAKRKAIESQRSWDLRLSGLVDGRKCGIPQKGVAAVVREDVQFLDSPPQTPLE